MESALPTTIDLAAGREHTQGITTGEFEHIVRSHQRRVFQVVLSLVRDRDLADNLTQDCFLRAFQKRSTFRGQAGVESWLIIIAINLVRDHARNRRMAFWRDIFRGASGKEPVIVDVPDPSPSAERALLVREQLDAVDCALNSASPRQRLVFSLRFFEEMTLDQIAATLQLDVGTVKAHLFRAVGAVRRKLKEQREK